MKRFLILATVLFLGCVNASEPPKDSPKRNRIIDNQADPKIEWTLTDKPGVWALFLNASKTQTGCYEPKTKTYHRLAGGKFFPEAPPEFLDLTVFDNLDENGDLKPLTEKEIEDLKKKLRNSIDKKKAPEPSKAGELPAEAGKGEAAGHSPASGSLQNFGLNLAGNFDEKESFRYMGKPIDREKAFQALEFGDIEGKQDQDQLADDSSKYRLTVIGPDKLRKSAVNTLKGNPRWKEIEPETILKDYPQNHWAITGKGFATQPAQVTYHLTDAEGVSIYEGTDPEGVFDGLRRKKKGGWDIDWNSWSLGINPWTWAPTIGFSTFHLSGELVLFALAALVVIVVIKNKRQPPKFP